MAANDTPYPLGRFVQHDPRSRNFAYPRKAVPVRSVTHVLRAPALHQGDLGSCTGNAAAQWLNSSVAVNNRKSGQKLYRTRKNALLTQPDAVELYSAATMDDAFEGTYPPVDLGSSGIGVAKAMQRFGFITSYTWTFSFEQFLLALQSQPVLVGVNWYEGMFEPDAEKFIRVQGFAVGGHEILARGVDYTHRRVRLRNSWGPQWGLAGDCFVSFADMERLLREDGDVVVPTVMKAV